jgi:hypothetical protein
MQESDKVLYYFELCSKFQEKTSEKKKIETDIIKTLEAVQEKQATIDGTFPAA